jgi:hypothetical protein
VKVTNTAMAKSERIKIRLKKCFLKVLCIPIFIFSFNSFAQTIVSGTLVSFESKQVIPFAHIYLTNTNTGSFLGTVSDTNGNFTLKISDERLNDSITISCVGYDNLKLKITTVNSDSIFLKESKTKLHPIVITDLSANLFIKKCIQNIPQNYKNATFYNHGFAWQAFEIDGVCRRFIQAFISATYNYTTERIVRKINYDSLNVQLIAETDEPIPEYDSLHHHLYFDLIRTSPSVLNLAHFNEWIFSYTYDKNSDFDDVVVIEAVSRGEFINNYIFYIDPKDFAFRKIEYHYRWPAATDDKPPVFISEYDKIKSGLVSKKNILKEINGLILYEKTDKKYNIKYLCNEVSYSQFTKEKQTGISHSKMKLFNEITFSHSLEKKSESTVLLRNKQAIEPIIINKEKYRNAFEAFRAFKK